MAVSYFPVVFLGAGLGGCMRHALNLFCQARGWVQLPFATGFINLTGSALMGFVVAFFASRGQHSPRALLFLTTGTLGGYTTFSTFSLETVLLVQRGKWPLALAYALGSVALGILGCWLGMSVHTWGSSLTTR